MFIPSSTAIITKKYLSVLKTYCINWNCLFSSPRLLSLLHLCAKNYCPHWQETKFSLDRFCPGLCADQENCQVVASVSKARNKVLNNEFFPSVLELYCQQFSPCFTPAYPVRRVSPGNLHLSEATKTLDTVYICRRQLPLCPSSWLGHHPAFSWIPLRLTLPCPALHHLSHFIPHQSASFSSLHINLDSSSDLKII